MLRGRILDRYIIREILPPFFLSIAVLTLALFLQKLFRLVELLLSKGSSPEAVAKLLLYILPGFLMVTLPISLLVATLTAFTRLSSDSEITAMKASRVSLYTMVRPVLYVSFALFLFTGVIANLLAPRSNFALKSHLFNMVKSKAMVGLEPGVFTSTFDGMIIYVDRMSSLDDMEGVFISDERSSSEPYSIVARHGKLTADPDTLNVTLSLEDGTVHPQPRGTENYSLMSFHAAALYLDIDHSVVRRRGSAARDIDETDSLRLLELMREARREGKPTKAMEIELHKRLSVSYACLIFGLIGAPLGIRRSRSGKSAGIAIAIGVILAYYMILATGANLAESGALSPLAAYWLPNGLITAGTLFLLVKKGHEIYFGLGVVASKVARKATDLFRKKPKL
ncbi:MAG: LPS export ABC transporter permease LptF [Nitrospiraceae bacterium]|nr:LPS export ABC transporter permease LptF [Nitrospiraceae bacterium]